MMPSVIRAREFWAAISIVWSAAIPLAGQQLTQASEFPVGAYRFANQLVPRWTNGALVAIEADGTASPSIHVFDRQGNKTRDINLPIPQARTVRVLSAAHTPKGGLALCGFAVDSQGHMADYLAFAEPLSEKIDIVRLTPYTPLAVAVAPNGDVWTVGFEVDEQRRPSKATDAGIIRRFTHDGKQVGAYLPSSNIPISDLTSGVPNLAATSDRVGWYQSESQSYFELSRDGTIQTYPGLALSGREYVHGLGITDRGDVFVTKYGNGNSADLYRLDRSTRTWLLVAPPSLERMLPNHRATALYTGRLVGVEGNSLVLRTVESQVLAVFLFE
jgi:hypothetical protein